MHKDGKTKHAHLSVTKRIRVAPLVILLILSGGVKMHGEEERDEGDERVVEATGHHSTAFWLRLF